MPEKDFNFSRHKLLLLKFLKQDFLPAKEIINSYLDHLNQKVNDLSPKVSSGAIREQLRELYENRIINKRRGEKLEYKLDNRYSKLPKIIEQLNIENVVGYSQCITKNDIRILEACHQQKKHVLGLSVDVGIDSKYIDNHIEKLKHLGLLEYSDYSYYKATKLGSEFLLALNIVSKENLNLGNEEISSKISD